MRVAFTYRSESHLRQALAQLGEPGPNLMAHPLDVEDRQAWVEAVEWLQQGLGIPDLLVVNAGMGTNLRISEATYQDWDNCLAVNLGGAVNTLTSLLPRMLEKGRGHIVLTASMSGLFPGGLSGLYTTSKFAVVGLAEALRAELADQGIGVSAFCPGIVRGSRIGLPDREGAPPHQVGMDPLNCGRAVLKGVQQNRLYILTHPEFQDGVAERNQALLASFPPPTDPQPWWELEKNVLRCPIHRAETERLGEG